MLFIRLPTINTTREFIAFWQIRSIAIDRINLVEQLYDFLNRIRLICGFRFLRLRRIGQPAFQCFAEFETGGSPPSFDRAFVHAQ